jgi:hypothetical protein
MDRIQQKQESRLQPKLSIVFNQQVNRIPHTFGAFYDGEGPCRSVKVLRLRCGSTQNAIASSADLIPPTLIERIEAYLLLSS